MWTAIILVSSFSLRTNHSTETALKAKNDLLCFLDNNKAVFIAFQDMSAAFDTVDHDILLGRLNYKFGIKHKFKSWFSVYLRDHFTKVPTDDDFSEDIVMRYSLPQGSITGPHRFILYTSPVGNIMRALISLSTLMLMIYSCTLGLIPDVKVCLSGCLLVLMSSMSG